MTDFGVFLGTAALIVACVFFVIAPPWIKRWLKKLDQLVTDIHEVKEIAKDPAYLAEVFSLMLCRNIQDEKGQPIDKPASVIQAIVMQTAVPMIEHYGPIALARAEEYVPQLIASAFSSDLARENQNRSTAARGASRLGGGIRGLQALQHGMRKMGGDKLGWVSEILEVAPALMDLAKTFKEAGLIKTGGYPGPSPGAPAGQKTGGGSGGFSQIG